jgi:L-iditol 2-dehydrogenase
MHCRDRASLGTHLDGGFAEFVVVPEANLHELPSELSDAAGALVEPLACVCNALFDPTAIQPGERVLVTGPGTIGILAAQTARALGAVVTLIGLDRDAERLALAKTLAIECVSMDDGEALSSLNQEVASGDISAVIECAGATTALEWGLQALHPRGRLIQVGLLPARAPVDLAPAVLREIHLSSSYGSTPRSWRRAVDLLASRTIQLEPLITRTVGLDDWKEAARLAGDAQGVKTVFDPRLTS